MQGLRASSPASRAPTGLLGYLGSIGSRLGFQRFASALQRNRRHFAAVQFAFPGRYHQRGDGVADDIGQGATFGHKTVHPEDQHHRRHRYGRYHRQARGQGDKPRTDHRTGALGGQHGHRQQGQLLLQRQVDIGRLGQEQHRQGHVDIGAVEVEGVAGGHHDADHALGTAQAFQLLDQLRQGRLRRAGAEHDQQLRLDIAQQAEDAETGIAGDAAQYAGDEDEGGQVEGAHQLHQRQQRAQAVFADGEGHRAERTNRRHPGNHADDAEEHLAGLVDHADQRTGFFTDHHQRQAEQDRDEQHRQDLALGEGVEEGGGDHMQQETGDAFAVLGLADKVGDGRGVEGFHIDVETRAGVQDMGGHEADRQGEGGDDLEVQQGLAADPPDLFYVVHAGDAGDHGAEDDRADDHLDQLDETVAQGLEVDAGLRPVVADQYPQHDGDDHLDIQGSQQFADCHCYYLVAGFLGGRGGK